MNVPLPEAFCHRVTRQYADGSELLTALDSPPSVSLRLHPEKSLLAGNPALFAKAHSVPWNPMGQVLVERPSYALDPLYHAGVYYPQESSSMFLRYVLEQLFNGNNAILALDLCAAPGGKSIELIDFVGPNGQVISNEIIKGRNAILRENLSRHGIANFIVTSSDAKHMIGIASEADLVLVDAPCSGEGMFRKDLSSRSEWSPELVTMCAKRQAGLLDEILPYMKQGSIVLYSTCTFAPEENDLLTERSFGLEDWENITIPLGALTGPVATQLGVSFLPHLVPGEGFYIAAFRKRTPGKDIQSPRPRNYFRALTKKEQQQGTSLIPSGPGYIVSDPGGKWYSTPFTADRLNSLSSTTMITLPGLPIGEWANDTFLPAHEWSYTAEALKTNYPQLDLGEQDALHFLRLGTSLPHREEKGIHLVTYRNVGIGWAKNLGTRWNNQLPKEWRLRS